MIKIRFIVVDKTKSVFLSQGEQFFLNRIKAYARIEWIETKGAKVKKNIPDEEILLQEGKSLARRIKQDDYIVALDRKGIQYDSPGLARWIEKLSIEVRGWVCFIIGGPLGLSQEILNRADKKLSLSELTLTHEMSRLLLAEQVYRAFTIINGEKYHK